MEWYVVFAMIHMAVKIIAGLGVSALVLVTISTAYTIHKEDELKRRNQAKLHTKRRHYDEKG